MKLRSLLRREPKRTLREKFVGHVGGRDSRRVLRVAAVPPRSDRLSDQLDLTGASVQTKTLSDVEQFEEQLPLLGSYDGVVVDPSGADGLSTGGLRMLTRAVLGGAVLFLDVDRESRLGKDLQRLHAESQGARDGLSEARVRLLECVKHIDIDPGSRGTDFDALVVVARATFVRVAETEVNDYLAQRPDRGRVLAEMPAAALVNRSQVAQSTSTVQHEPTPTLPAPPLFLREYHDVVASPRQILTQAGVLLPDSFRKPMKRPPGHQSVRLVGDQMVTFKAAKVLPQELPGSYFYLDSEFRGHFGHAVTEQLSRLWAWSMVKEHDPAAKCLLLNRNRKDRPVRPIMEYERLLYGAAGVAPEDLHLAQGSVRVERMYAATPSFAQPQYVHPKVADIWSETGDRLAALASDSRRPRRVFCGRKHDKRACHNGAEVEQLFIDHGFTVVYPEDHPLPEQVAMFRDAEVVAGYAGSALFTAMFLDRPTHLILVSSESYSAENEYRIAAVLGHQVSVAWCRADLTNPGGGFDKEVFHSAYSFDFAREGVFLKQVLADL